MSVRLTVALAASLSALAYWHIRRASRRRRCKSKFSSMRRDPNRLDFGHRLESLDAPENTLEALEVAIANGCIGVEFDVAITEDHVPVAMHDATLDRTTNGSGPVLTTPFCEVCKLDAACHRSIAPGRPSFHELGFAGVGVPTVEAVLRRAVEARLLIALDVKAPTETQARANLAGIPIISDLGAQSYEPLVDRLVDFFQKMPELYDYCAVCSFDMHLLARVKSRDPRIRLGMTHRKWRVSTTPAGAQRQIRKGASLWTVAGLWACDQVQDLCARYLWWWWLDVDLVLLNIGGVNSTPLIGADELSKWAARGIELIVWTANSREDKDRLSSEGCMFMTDATDPRKECSTQ
jgi:glycerophosphoryl diester phosphodiesterase